MTSLSNIYSLRKDHSSPSPSTEEKRRGLEITSRIKNALEASLINMSGDLSLKSPSLASAGPLTKIIYELPKNSLNNRTSQREWGGVFDLVYKHGDSSSLLALHECFSTLTQDAEGWVKTSFENFVISFSARGWRDVTKDRRDVTGTSGGEWSETVFRAIPEQYDLEKAMDAIQESKKLWEQITTKTQGSNDEISASGSIPLLGKKYNEKTSQNKWNEFFRLMIERGNAKNLLDLREHFLKLITPPPQTAKSKKPVMPLNQQKETSLSTGLIEDFLALTRMMRNKTPPSEKKALQNLNSFLDELKSAQKQSIEGGQTSQGQSSRDCLVEMRKKFQEDKKEWQKKGGAEAANLCREGVDGMKKEWTRVIQSTTFEYHRDLLPGLTSILSDLGSLSEIELFSSCSDQINPISEDLKKQIRWMKRNLRTFSHDGGSTLGATTCAKSEAGD